jgi:hypothetical protein
LGRGVDVAVTAGSGGSGGESGWIVAIAFFQIVSKSVWGTGSASGACGSCCHGGVQAGAGSGRGSGWASGGRQLGAGSRV